MSWTPTTPNDDWGNDWEDDGILSPSAAIVETATKAAMAPKQPILERKASYSILTLEEIEKRKNLLVNDVCDLCGVSAGDATILLRMYNWKKGKLLDEWLMDSDKVRQKSGLKRNPLALVRSSSSTNNNSMITCNICTDDVNFRETYAMPCNHRFCNTCWQSWVEAEMEKGPTAVQSVCPEHKCGETMPDEVFSKFLDSKMLEKYHQYNLTSFVTGCASLKFCPGPGCGRVVEMILSGGSRDVECVCGYRFCFGCERLAHRPVPCDICKKWAEKNASDSENANWMMANTKICPGCKVSIEKNQGCNHMTCKLCKHEFCWLCKIDWKKHGTASGGQYQCNQYKAPGAEDETKNAEAAANSLNRYIHYYTRFDNHGKAAKLAEKDLAKCDGKMKVLQDLKGTGYMDVQFVPEAIQTVIRCRYVLQWTYGYGYFLEDNTTQKTLFEGYQAQLEKFAEHLHGLVEKPLEILKEIDMRTEVINFMRVTEKYRENIVKAIENNFADDK